MIQGQEFTRSYSVYRRGTKRSLEIICNRGGFSSENVTLQSNAVKFLYNESETTLPALTPFSGCWYDWDDVREYFVSLLDTR